MAIATVASELFQSGGHGQTGAEPITGIWGGAPSGVQAKALVRRLEVEASRAKLRYC